MAGKVDAFAWQKTEQTWRTYCHQKRMCECLQLEGCLFSSSMSVYKLRNFRNFTASFLGRARRRRDSIMESCTCRCRRSHPPPPPPPPPHSWPPLARHYIVTWPYHVMDGRGRLAFTLTKRTCLFDDFFLSLQGLGVKVFKKLYQLGHKYVEIDTMFYREMFPDAPPEDYAVKA